MKKFFLFLIPIFIGVFLVISCKTNTPDQGEPTDSALSPTDAAHTIAAGSIVYVELDSITSNYLMTIDLAAELEAKMTKMDTDLTNRQRRFQTNVADFENKFNRGLETRARLAEIEQQLNIEQQNIMQMAENYRMEMAEEQAVMQRKIIQAIMDFLKEYQKDKGYQYILGNAFDAKILYADPSLNITAPVLEGLNAKYRTEKR